MTDEKIKHLLKLSKLAIDAGEAVQLCDDLSKIVEFIDVVKNESAGHPELQNESYEAASRGFSSLREDIPLASPHKNMTLNSAAEKSTLTFSVPKIFNNTEKNNEF